MRLSLFFLKHCIIKQLLDSVFVISEIIKVSVSVITYLDLDYTGYHKKTHPIIVSSFYP